jgi:RNA polymerase sigma-70 factor (ECF subfamily)
VKGVIKDMTLNDTYFEKLINDYGNDVLRVSFIYLKDRQLAEDAFQEVFLRVYKKYHSFKHESSEKTWIIKITINICKDMLKTNWHKKVILQDEEIVNITDDKNVESVVENKELLKQILNLPSKYKDVILLFYYQGFSIKEIAEILSTTTGNVSSLLSRARNILKTNLEEEVDYGK